MKSRNEIAIRNSKLPKTDLANPTKLLPSTRQKQAVHVTHRGNAKPGRVAVSEREREREREREKELGSRNAQQDWQQASK